MSDDPSTRSLTASFSTTQACCRTEQQRFLFQLQYSATRKDRVLILVFSIFLGGLGIDRFVVGNIGLGLLRLLTGGICGILWVIDRFLIMGRVDEVNRRKAH